MRNRWTLLDVGTGAGDIPVAAQRLGRRYGIELIPIGLERIPEAARAARRAGLATVLADLKRSVPAMAGMWLAAFPLGLHRTTRHDAVLSLQRGYTREEFEGMLREAGIGAPAHYRPIARIVAAWEPGPQTSDLRRQTTSAEV